VRLSSADRRAGGSGLAHVGGSARRNMASSMTGAPATYDIKTCKNVKWVARLGSQSYGNTVVANGQVYVGTNNELARNQKEPGDRSVLMLLP
jgi:hypothetical protein